MLQPGEGVPGRANDDRSDTSTDASDQSQLSQNLAETRSSTESLESQNGGDNSKAEYLVALDYQSDAERKRVEYLLDNRSEIDVEKTRGLARIVRVDEDDFKSFYEDLSAKVDALDHLRVNELVDVDVTPDENHEQFHIETDAPRDQVNWAFETIKRKRNATVEDQDSQSEQRYKQYVATTQSGTVRYSYELDAVDESTTHVDIHVWGYGEAPEVMRAFIEEELSYAI
jgi:hypothetical protein